ncbi:hypothetical protein ELI46_39950 [Rhizobium ruizarguesonis]|nr:hypothetical protein ELI46_39950 [Rhizobium ruizarguesonis]
MERANSRSMAPQKARAPGAITATRSGSGRSLLADPLWVDRGRSGTGPGRHHRERDWDAFVGRLRQTMMMLMWILSWSRYLGRLFSLTSGPRMSPPVAAASHVI